MIRSNFMYFDDIQINKARRIPKEDLSEDDIERYQLKADNYEYMEDDETELDSIDTIWEKLNIEINTRYTDICYKLHNICYLSYKPNDHLMFFANNSFFTFIFNQKEILNKEFYLFTRNLSAYKEILGTIVLVGYYIEQNIITDIKTIHYIYREINNNIIEIITELDKNAVPIYHYNELLNERLDIKVQNEQLFYKNF